MRVLWQPTVEGPGDWEEVDSRAWGSLASVDFHGLCVQGRIYDGADHYAVRNLPSGGVKVFVWYDDPDDWPPGHRWARVATHPLLGPDPTLGGAINVLCTDVIYAEDEIRPILDAAYAGNPRVTIEPWSSFREPQAKHLHGKWVPDRQHEDLRAARRIAGWREWTEGLDEALCLRGCVKQQRVNVSFLPPKGTRTYYASDNAGPVLQTASFNRTFTMSPAGAANVTDAGVNQNGNNIVTFVSPTNEPNSAAWPTTGVYRYQIDATAVGADLTYGILTQGNGLGRFARTGSAGTTELQTFQQSQAAFSSAGLNIASITNPAWSAGAATNRWGATLAGVRVVGHGNQTLTVQVGELDDFTDGPWAAAVVGGSRRALFFGTPF